jgi:hypothetical protein
MIHVESELPEISEINYDKVSFKMDKFRKEASELLLGRLDV